MKVKLFRFDRIGYCRVLNLNWFVTKDILVHADTLDEGDAIEKMNANKLGLSCAKLRRSWG